MIKKVFFNVDENRLRAGLRIIIFLITYILLSRILTKLSYNITGKFERTTWEWWAVRGIIVIIVSSLVVWFIRKFIDKRTFASLGLSINKLAIKDFLVGLGISGLMIGVIFLLFLTTGLLEINEVGWSSGGILALLQILLWFFGIGLAIGWSEELAFRGYLLQNMKDGLGIIWAIIISCLIYGVMHMANPGSSILSGSLIALIGFLRIFGWLRTGQLWLSMGMHAGWDFLMGPIFGFPVSGMTTETLFKITVGGKGWLTGGAFGPEAGILVIPIIFIGLGLIYFWTYNRKDTK